MFYQIFLSPQVKRCTIITYIHGTYELPHELPNDLRLKEVKKYQESVKMPLVYSLPAKMNTLSILAKALEK